MQIRFKRFFSTDNPKAIKAEGYGYLNAINYMSPHTLGGVGDLCSHASKGCIFVCLGDHAGQAAISDKVKDSRKRKAQYFMLERAAFMAEAVYHIRKLILLASASGLKLAIRMNGSTDVAFEGLALEIDGVRYRNIFEAFPNVQFMDYTKNPARMNRKLPANYHLTFSRSEKNDKIAFDLLKAGKNVAIVMDHSIDRTSLLPLATIVDGDKHDLRFLDPVGSLVVLTPKGNRAKKDISGFVIRSAQSTLLAA